MSLNRIYQGGVSYVEIENPDKTARKEIPWLLYHHDPTRAAELTKLIPELREKIEAEIAKRAKLSKDERKGTQKSPELEKYEKLRDEQRQQWTTSVWGHHQLFQDAVNYYAFALAAMARGMTEKDEDGKEKPTAMANFTAQVFDRWEDFDHKGGKRPGLKHSLARTLRFPDANSITPEQCVDRIFGHAYEKFPKTTDGKLHDAFRGVIGELFPAKSRGKPQQLANEDAGWLCSVKKGGEPPGEKTYRNQHGIYDFMDKLFQDDAVELMELAKLTVRESCLTGVVESGEEEEEGDAAADQTIAETEETAEAEDYSESGLHEGEHAITKLEQCVKSAESLLEDEMFKRIFGRISRGKIDIKQGIAHLKNLVAEEREQEEVWKKQNPTQASSFHFQKWKTQGPGKDNPRVEMFVLFHCDGGSEFTATLLKARLLQKKLPQKWLHSTDKRRYVQLVESLNLAGTEDGLEAPEKVEKARKAAAKPDYQPTVMSVSKTDFIPRLRKELGYTFPSFTAIRGFVADEGDPATDAGACKPGYFSWTKFENAAYEEAIKSPHQIRQKTKEREKEAKKLKDLKALYEGAGREKGKTDDGEEEDFIPGGFNANGDPRFAAMQRIHKALGVPDGADPKTIYRYGISQAALRGYEEVREAWNKKVAPGEQFSAPKATELRDCIAAYQRQHRDDMGDSRFLEELTKENNWCVWQNPTPQEEKERVAKLYSTNIVRDYLRYCDVLEELDRKDPEKNPIKYTPADASESRRLFDFKGAMQGSIKHLSSPDGLSFTTQIAAKTTLNGRELFCRREVRIHYTAPRLLRDEARVLSDNEDLQSSNWAQPLMRALGLPEDDQQKFKDHAVSLMPDWKPGSRNDHPDRLLLNFVLTPDEDQFIANLRQQMGREPWPWDWQFICFGKGKKPREYTQTVLCWPHESTTWNALKKKKGFPAVSIGDKPQPCPWYVNPSLKSFRLLSVDLGQKQAGAYALIELSCGLSDAEKKAARFIGRTEHNGERRDWYARVITTGLLKLPGEDATVFRPDFQNGKPVPGSKDFREELSGSAGRLATLAETRQTLDLLKELQQLNLVGDNPTEVETACQRLTFPEQNAKLLIALRRAQSFAGKLHRWCWFLDPQDEVKREDQPKRRRTAIKEIAESDPNEWLNKDAHTKAKNRNVRLDKAEEESELHPEIVAALKTQLEELAKKLPGWLEITANRIYRSRKGQFIWITHPDKSDCHLLDFSLLSEEERRRLTNEEKWLAGQRGLSIERIEQLEELRKRCQSLNQMLRREIGCAPKATRDDSIPDPCPAILGKLDEIKEQRRNQTAHMILTQALGLTLAKPKDPANDLEREDREAKDAHGEYVKADEKGHAILPEKGNKWRGVVDFIVVEDLSRYRTSQGRAPRENSRLMKWCHRAIRDKLKQMCEPFGVPLVETPAAYSSRFCSRTGVAGFRATEISGDPLEQSKWRWRIRKPEEGKEETDPQQQRRELWEVLLGQVRKANQGRDGKTKGQEFRTLLAPEAGGSIFIPISNLDTSYQRPGKGKPIIQFAPVSLEENQTKRPRLVHADINAAVNLGLRAVADPRVWSIHSRLRSERKPEMLSSQKPGRGKGRKKAATTADIPVPDIKPDTFYASEREKRKFGEQTKENRIQIKVLAAQRLLEQADQAPGESEKRKLREKAVASVPKASDSRHPNFFADIADLHTWIHDHAATLDGLPANVPQPKQLVNGKALWGYVSQEAWKRCTAINATRLRAWELEPPKDWEA